MKTIHVTFCYLIAIHTNEEVPQNYQEGFTTSQLVDFGDDIASYLKNQDAATSSALLEAQGKAAELAIQTNVECSADIIQLSVTRTELPYDLQTVRDMLVEAQAEAVSDVGSPE